MSFLGAQCIYVFVCFIAVAFETFQPLESSDVMKLNRNLEGRKLGTNLGFYVLLKFCHHFLIFIKLGTCMTFSLCSYSEEDWSFQGLCIIQSLMILTNKPELIVFADNLHFQCISSNKISQFVNGSFELALWTESADTLKRLKNYSLMNQTLILVLWTQELEHINCLNFGLFVMQKYHITADR